MGPHCVWLITIGGTIDLRDTGDRLRYKGEDVTDPKITMLIELGN